MPLEGKMDLAWLRRFGRVVRIGRGVTPNWPGRIERRGKASKLNPRKLYRKGAEGFQVKKN